VLDRLIAAERDGVRVTEVLRLTDTLAVFVREMAADALPVRLCAGEREINGDAVDVRLMVAVRVAVSVPTADFVT
jgi:hypothetical protein